MQHVSPFAPARTISRAHPAPRPNGPRSSADCNPTRRHSSGTRRWAFAEQWPLACARRKSRSGTKPPKRPNRPIRNQICGRRQTIRPLQSEPAPPRRPTVTGRKRHRADDLELLGPKATGSASLAARSGRE